MAIVTVNAGSSSIKVTAFSGDESSAEMSRLGDISLINIGQESSTLQIIRPNQSPYSKDVRLSDYAAGVQLITEKLADFVPIDKILAIGHRLVHGGIKYTNATPTETISPDDWRILEQLDPDHTPGARHLIDHFTRYVPSARQVACFDTTFFQDLPYTAKLIPIPKEYYKIGVRRYGFHGLSYASLLDIFHEKAGGMAANGRVILAHLGSGASMTATRKGRPIETTMGFTPTSGLVMSTRSGDLDPNIFGFLHRQKNIELEQFEKMTNSESGLLGISAVSGDMRQLLSLENENDDAKIAIDLFIQSVKKSIGAFSAILGGVDSVIFSGGIGERSSILRARICQGLEYLGIEIDKTANEHHSFLISSTQSTVGVHVIPTDEARVIAKQTIELLNISGKIK